MRLRVIGAASAFVALSLGAQGSIASDSSKTVGGGPTAEECANAWSASPAYPECGTRSAVSGGQPESVKSSGPLCVIVTSCQYNAMLDSDGSGVSSFGKVTLSKWDNTWHGTLSDAGLLQNCNGRLWPSC